MVKFTPAKLDSNTWFHVTEGRTDKTGQKFRSMLYVEDAGNRADGPLLVYPNQTPPQYWQFQPAGEPGQYAIRCSKVGLGVTKQLAVCYNRHETDDHRTGVCMLPSNGEDRQIWQIDEWDNTGEYRFTNKANGTDFYLDIHKGNPIYMSPKGNPEDRPSRHWIMTSASAVNEADFSTVFTNIAGPTTRTSTVTKLGHGPTHSADASHSSGSGGLSTAASAGIGIGVALGAIILGVGAFLLWRKWRQSGNSRASEEAGLGGSPTTDYKDQNGAYSAVPSANSPHPSELSPPPQQMAHETHGDSIQHHELDASPVHR